MLLKMLERKRQQKMFKIFFTICCLLTSFCFNLESKAKALTVGSKPFLESNLLAEITVLKFQEKGFKISHKKSMGGTAILWKALQKGDLDFYPEYTGTIQEVILGNNKNFGKNLSNREIKKELAKLGIGMTASLGFNNSYGLAMRRTKAEQLSVERISDLQKHSGLHYAFTHEFMNRKDGWQRLKDFYKFSPQKLQSIEHTIEHSLAFKSIESGKTDLIDINTTDPQIKSLDLKVLKDDKAFFPQYEAVFLYRLDLEPNAKVLLKSLEGKLVQKKIIELNTLAEKDKEATSAAKAFLGLEKTQTKKEFLGLNKELPLWFIQHLILVSLSLLLAIILGIPLGIMSYSNKLLSNLILNFTGIIQTIPSLALLALLVPVMGIKFETALLALFLYSLLPIVKNTFIA
ncbi:MAG: glycine betaine ABC transporter substrate-binding protein, partial [Candidatus Caenarcaniphilales bacterium]|nr:glycine betaine ABC transporter substrate-binding protein [Candidatus Caenarcaniphilales bacterium]